MSVSEFRLDQTVVNQRFTDATKPSCNGLECWLQSHQKALWTASLAVGALVVTRGKAPELTEGAGRLMADVAREAEEQSAALRPSVQVEEMLGKRSTSGQVALFSNESQVRRVLVPRRAFESEVEPAYEGRYVPVLERQGTGVEVLERKCPTETPTGKIYGDYSHAVVQVYGRNGNGTGVITSYSGRIATSYHVLGGSLAGLTPRIKLWDGTELATGLVARDKGSDLAILQILRMPEVLSIRAVHWASSAEIANSRVLRSIGYIDGFNDPVLGYGSRNQQILRFHVSDETLRLLNGDKPSFVANRARFLMSRRSFPEDSPSSIRHALVAKFRTSLPALPRTSGSPVFAESGGLAGLINGGGPGPVPENSFVTHAAHLQAMDAELPGRDFRSWRDIRTRAEMVDGQLAVRVISSRKVSNARTLGVLTPDG